MHDTESLFFPVPRDVGIMMKGRLNALRRTKLYELFAAAPVIAWFVFCVTQMLPSLAQRVELVMLFVRTDPSVLPATLVVQHPLGGRHAGFLRAVDCDVYRAHYSPAPRARFYPRFAAVVGSFSSLGFLLLPPQELSYELYLASLLLLITGIVFAICALRCSRAFNQHPAGGPATGNRGPYALVRHPLYLGEMVAITGVTLQYLSVWALLLLALRCAVQLQRMKNEERVLSQSFPEYGDYMARTARLVPACTRP